MSATISIFVDELDTDQAKEIIENIDNYDGAEVDGDVEVNNSPNFGGNDGVSGGDSSNDGAFIALSVILALVLLGIIAAAVYIKRR